MLSFCISLSAKSTANIEDYDWYRFEGKRKVYLESATHEADIAEKDVFGVRVVRKNVFHIVHRDDPTVVFVGDAAVARSLLGRSRPFSGVIKGVRVTNTKTAHIKQTPSSRPDIEPTPYFATPGSIAEDTALTKLLYQAKIQGANRLRFIRAVPLPTGEVYHYYDASETFAKYGTRRVDQWSADLSKAVVAATKTHNYVVGADFVVIDGQKIPCLALVIS